MDALVDEPNLPFGDYLNMLLETKAISVDPLLGTLSDLLIYPLVIAGEVSMEQVRSIMGESVQTHHTLKPPMKHVLCRVGSLAEVITKTHALEGVRGVKYVTISLNREVLDSTDLRHSLIRNEIKKLEKFRER